MREHLRARTHVVIAILALLVPLSGAAAASSDDLPPHLPRNLAVQIDAVASSVTLTWDAPAGGAPIVGYLVTASVPVPTLGFIQLDASADSYVFQDYPVDAEYQFTVCSLSATAGSACETISKIPPESPSAPSKMAFGMDPGGASMTVSWDAPTWKPHVVGYHVTLWEPRLVGPVQVEVSTRSYTFGDVVVGDRVGLNVCAVREREDGSHYDRCAETQGIAGYLPGPPLNFTVTMSETSASLTWAPPTDEGLPALTKYVVWADELGGKSFKATARGGTFKFVEPLTGTEMGLLFTFNIRAISPVGTSPTTQVDAATAPQLPRIRKVRSGAPGAPLTASVEWIPGQVWGPSAPILGYRIRAYPTNKRGNRRGPDRYSPLIPGSARRYEMRLPEGRWRFGVQALNQGGMSAWAQTEWDMQAIAR